MILRRARIMATVRLARSHIEEESTFFFARSPDHLGDCMLRGIFLARILHSITAIYCSTI